MPKLYKTIEAYAIAIETHLEYDRSGLQRFLVQGKDCKKATALQIFDSFLKSDDAMAKAAIDAGVDSDDLLVRMKAFWEERNMENNKTAEEEDDSNKNTKPAASKKKKRVTLGIPSPTMMEIPSRSL